jgi:branched-subunit amino acid transport protein
VNVWLIMLLAGILTYAIRLSFILFYGKKSMPARLQQGLRFVPPAVLSAIIFPELLMREGELDLSFGNPRLLAGILAALVAWRTKNVILTIVAGMVVLLLLQYLVV